MCGDENPPMYSEHPVVRIYHHTTTTKQLVASSSVPCLPQFSIFGYDYLFCVLKLFCIILSVLDIMMKGEGERWRGGRRGRDGGKGGGGKGP